MAKSKLPVEKLKASKAKPIPVRIVSDYPSPVESTKEQRNYRAEDALRAIQRAEEYKRDKDLMSDVKKLAQSQMSDLKKIC